LRWSVVSGGAVEWWSSGVVEQWSGGKERVASDAATAGE